MSPPSDPAGDHDHLRGDCRQYVAGVTERAVLAASWPGHGCAAARKIRAFCPDAAWRRAVALYAPQSRNGRRAKLWSPLLGWAICSIPAAGWFRDFHRSGGDKGP